jgi:Holliday junction resolvase RusA-like endonuclease
VTTPGLRFVVYGTPATKGSMKAVPIGGGRSAIVESHKTAKPWREAVKSAARDAMAELEVDVVYSFRKPKSAPRRRRIWPITRSSGDVDKLARNILDALVDVGVMGDDSQVVRLVGEKAFCGEAPSQTDVPSARIIVRPLPAAVREEQLAAQFPDVPGRFRVGRSR